MIVRLSVVEGMGFEPMDQLPGHGLANRSFNHSGNPLFCMLALQRTANVGKYFFHAKK